jgi:hypothetical protein
MSRVARTLSTIIATLGLALLLPLGTTSAADCTLTATPRSGAPGTEFVFKGNGFTPTTLSLKRGNEAAKVVDVSGGSSSSFTYQLIAEDEDVGKWRAVAEGCSDTVSVRVTLPPTTTAATTRTPPPDDNSQLTGLVLLGVLFLGATALLLPRLTRAARSR